MIQKITGKPLIYINAKDMAEMHNEIARRSNTYALSLMSEGIRGDVTAKDVINATKQIPAFNKKGFMTKEGRKKIFETINIIFGVNNKQAEKVTLGDFINRTLACLVHSDTNLHAIKNGVEIIK